MPTAPNPRSALSAENLALLEAVSRLGSMAAAARELGMVPSALTYRVRQIEDALDVLLFDRSARRAVLTPAGAELLRSGEYLLNELDAVAQRVKRVATGWEPQLSIAADAVISRATLFELCEAFYATGAPTRLRLRAETLSGTLEALQTGQADLALGLSGDLSGTDLQIGTLGSVVFGGPTPPPGQDRTTPGGRRHARPSGGGGGRLHRARARRHPQPAAGAGRAHRAHHAAQA